MFNKQKVLEKAKARVAKLETELASKPLAGDELESAISSRITDAKDRLKTDPNFDDPHLQKTAASMFSSGPTKEAVTMASHKAMSQAQPKIIEDTDSTTSWKGGGNYEYKLDKASGDIFITKAPDGGYTGKVRQADPLASIKAELATLKPNTSADTKVNTTVDSKPVDSKPVDSKPPETSEAAKNALTAAIALAYPYLSPALVTARVADILSNPPKDLPKMTDEQKREAHTREPGVA